MEIIALTNLEIINKSQVDVDQEGTPIDSNVLVFNNGNNKWHLTGLSPDKFYIRNGEKFSFLISDYDKWKEFLLKLVGSNSISFAELIQLKPEGGIIGLVCAKKLKEDFKDFQTLVNQSHSELSTQFNKWIKAFSLASNKGAVIFA